MTDQTRQPIYYTALIVALVLAIYGNTLNHGFVWDDADVIVENPQTRSLANISSFFVTGEVTEADQEMKKYKVSEVKQKVSPKPSLLSQGMDKHYGRWE